MSQFTKSMISAALKVLPLCVVFMAPSAYALTCYEYKETAASVDCGNGATSRSADFTIQCKDIPATVEEIEIPCPFRWVNTDGTKTHAEVCSGEGLSTTVIDGAVCSSGERRAPNTYNFIYGKWGGVGSAGGTHTTTMGFAGSIGGRDNDNGAAPARPTYHYCWGNGQKKDYDRTDIVTAYPCGTQ